MTPDNQDQLWAQRKHYYFKPYAGFGGRGTYRGSSLTKKVWSHITQGGYIAQKRILPPLRAVTRDKNRVALKFDLRVYVYDGEPLLLGARVYEGQTTNLRTEGGGLAPVIVLNDQMTDACYAINTFRGPSAKSKPTGSPRKICKVQTSRRREMLCD